MNPPASPNSSQELAIIGARLIDGRGGAPIESSVVLIRANRIVAVGTKEKTPIPEGFKRLDASGKSVLPGLIDSHFHSRDSAKIPIEYELQNGITSFRDPGHPFRYYDKALGSDEAMPRIFLCGGHLDAEPVVWPDQAKRIATDDDAREAVRKNVANGASAIKVYFRLPLAQIKAACETAEKHGVPVTAHLELVKADAAIQAGVRGIEHVTSFGIAIAEEEAANNFTSMVYADSSARRILRHRLWANIQLNDNARVDSMIAGIIKNEVFVSPTLAIFESRKNEKQATEEKVIGFQTMLRFVGLCNRAGASIVVGSHTSAPFAETGKAYKRELELLVEAGLSPMEAITAATYSNARFFGIEQRLGSIEPNKVADLILVDGNPAASISDIDNIDRVMLNGNWVHASTTEVVR